MLRLLPLPRPDFLIEHEIRLLTPPGVVKGFVDLFVPRPEADGWPVGLEADLPTVFDHKTTANLSYAKSEDDLLTDPQALLYGLAARVHVKEKTGKMPEHVGLVWNYVQTKGEPYTRSVRVRQSLKVLESGLEPLFAQAADMATALKTRPQPNDMPYNTDSCDKYGGCSYRDICPHARKAGSVSLSDLETLPPTAHPVAEPEQKKEPEPMSDTLERLRKLNASKMTVKAPPAEKPAEPPPAETKKATEPEVRISPEPKLEKLPTEGVVASEVEAPIVPPDAPKPSPAKSRKAKSAEPAPPAEVLASVDNHILAALSRHDYATVITLAEAAARIQVSCA